MKLDKKRRLEYKTDYKKRLILLKSKSLRLVIRKSNRYVTIQIVKSKDAQDEVLFSVNTKELLKYGWPKERIGSLKSLPASYLGGLLLGKKVKQLKEEIILDSGLAPNIKGSKIYAAVKGIIDSGIKVKHNEKIFPSVDRMEGKNSKIELKTFNKIKETIQHGK